MAQRTTYLIPVFVCLWQISDCLGTHCIDLAGLRLAGICLPLHAKCLRVATSFSFSKALFQLLSYQSFSTRVWQTQLSLLWKEK